MKRKTIKLFAGMLGMTVLLSLTACGSLDQTAKAPVTSIVKDSADETEAETNTGTISTKNETQDKNKTQTETGTQDKTEAQAENALQDKAETQTENGQQDKAETEQQNMTETQAENKGQDKAGAQSKTESETEPEEGTTNDPKQYETLEDYFNDPETKNDFDEQIASSSTDDIAISYDVKGNELTCTIKLSSNSIIGTNVDDIKAALNAGLEAQADTFKELIKELDELVGKEGACTIIVKYTDFDGNIFAEKAFKAN